MTDFNPSPQQAQALKRLEIFLARPGSGVFILKGYAGTGKTTLLQHLGRKLAKKKEEFMMLAPTGRAAVVLRAKTGIPTSTIHSELYKFSDVDGEPEKADGVPEVDEYGQMRLVFALRSRNEDNMKKIYIVDEASMISDEPGDVSSYAHFGSGHLLSDLLAAIGTAKVIFAGDPSQLPPVGSALSPALSEAYFKAQGKVVESYELTDILRQKKDSEILQLATKVRKQTELRTFPKWLKLPAVAGRQISLMSYHNLKQYYVELLTRNGFENSIAVCHSNFNCADINKTVRQRLYGSSNAPLQVGDLLMITQNNHIVPLTNGDFVTVSGVGERELYLNIAFIRVRLKAQLSGVEYECLMCMEPLYNGQANLTQQQQRALMIDFSRRMRKKGIRPKTERYNTALQEDPYLNSVRANFGYAVTCHKSQGGEWDQVFFFLNKGMYSMGYPSLARWWYTGVTRAREKLYVVSDWWIE